MRSKKPRAGRAHAVQDTAKQTDTSSFQWIICGKAPAGKQSRPLAFCLLDYFVFISILVRGENLGRRQHSREPVLLVTNGSTEVRKGWA